MLVRAALLALLTACLGSACAPRPAPPARPNVLLIVLDTLRRDHLSAYGYAAVATPTLDALARRGVVFDDCLAQSSWTMPSMISLMTGQPLFSNLYRVPESVPMLAEHFAAEGYRTGAFVANALVGEEAGFGRGFDVFEARQKKTAAWDAARVVDGVRAFLDAEPDGERPFLVWAHFLDTHAPYTPATTPARLPPEEVLEPADLAAVEAVLAALPDDDRARLRWQVPELAREVQRYDAELAALDAELGGLLELLETRGLTETTYVAVVADHGEGLFRRPQHPDRLEVLRDWRQRRGEPLLLADLLKKEHDGWLYEELVATPWLLAGPELPAGRRVAELVTNMDVLPTLAGLCGLAPVRVSGRDLSGALRDGGEVPPAELAVTACSGSMAARLPDGRKLILPEARLTQRFGLQPELYDLRADPFEQSPLPLDDAARALEQRLRAAALADPFRAAYDAPDDETLEGLRELGYVR